MLDAIKHIAGGNVFFQEDSATGVLCVTQSN